MQTHWLIADDLTGGNDAGIQFAKHGLSAWMAVSETGACPNGTGVFVVNTNTRNASGDEAAAVLTSLARSLTRAGNPADRVVFKKIDSTLRGQPGVELESLMDHMGFDVAFLAPSYPGQGRTVREGTLLVHGKPVNQTEFASDPLCPVDEAFVPRLVGARTRRGVGLVPLCCLEEGGATLEAAIDAEIRAGKTILVFDGAEQQHLRTVVRAGCARGRRPLFIGAAGLAEEVAAHVGTTQPPLVPAMSAKVLFVCGSANRMTHVQTDALTDAGLPLFRVPLRELHELGEAESVCCDAENVLLERLRHSLQDGPAILAAPLARCEGPAEGCMPPDIPGALGGLVRRLLTGLENGSGRAVTDMTLVMTGGETALAVLERMDVQGLLLHRELLTGIAQASITGGRWDGLTVVTKAGGFGQPDTLVRLLHNAFSHTSRSQS